MTCAVISIGTELTRGELVNTNASWLSSELTNAGFDVVEQATVADEKARIASLLTRLSKAARIVVCTGGLGPTTDDLTSECVAETLRVKLTRDEQSLDNIKRRFERLGRVMSESNAKQADFPEGAEILPNPVGTAPGFSVRYGLSLIHI